MIVGSYLATIYPKISLEDKSAAGNNLEHNELIDLANHLFPRNPLCMSVANEYYQNQGLVSLFDSPEVGQELKAAAESHLGYDDRIKLFFLPKDKEGFQSKIQQFLSNLSDEQSAQVISISTQDEFTRIESSYFHYDSQNKHFSALIPIDRFNKQFNKAIEGLQINGEAVKGEKTPSSSPALTGEGDLVKKEAEKINNELLEQLRKSKELDDQEVKNKAQKEFNSPPIYSGLGLKVELVGNPPSENYQEEFEYKYKITGCIESGLASGFYNLHSKKDLHIVFKCKPEEHDQVITNIRNLDRAKENEQPLFEIWSGIQGEGDVIAGGNAKLDSKSKGLEMLYGIFLGAQSDIPERKFYKKNKDNVYEVQSYENYIGESSKEAGASGAGVVSGGAGRGS